MSILKSIDLSMVIKKYPEVLNDNLRLKALLHDLYPDRKLEINLIHISDLLGVPDEISEVSIVNDRTIKQLMTLMERNYGISAYYSYYAVRMWAAAFGKECASIEINNVGEDIHKRNLQENAQQEISRNTIVMADDNIEVRFVNIEGVDLEKSKSIGSIFRVYCILLNKSNKNMHISVFNRAANGIVFDTSYESSGPFEPGYKKLYCFSFDLHELCLLGFTQSSEIESIEFELAYGFKGNFYHIEEKAGSSKVFLPVSL